MMKRFAVVLAAGLLLFMGACSGGEEPEEKTGLTQRFEDEVFPLLTPMALSASPGQPFPRLT